MQKSSNSRRKCKKNSKNRNGIGIADAKLDFILYMSCEVEEEEKHNRGMQYAN